ncbi:hypothetical protein SAMN04487859_10799 [Roseovarius lutimaris]|uniref:Uncharacterized protein n=1 Tax=Roseovarius lutimaris TaxID=1005928 RepID=A0A1I5B702_9RHOB|nr:hypothetical protein SAMN04487859_10799 [Roseovarius lutimaris]
MIALTVAPRMRPVWPGLAVPKAILAPRWRTRLIHLKAKATRAWSYDRLNRARIT